MPADKLNINVKLDGAVGRIENTPKPRTLLAKFSTYNKRQQCLRTSSNLKGTSVFLNENVCRKSLGKRRLLMDELRDKRRQRHIAYFSGDRLVVKNRSKTSGNASQTSAGSHAHRPGVSSTLVPLHLRPDTCSKAGYAAAPARR